MTTIRATDAGGKLVQLIMQTSNDEEIFITNRGNTCPPWSTGTIARQ
ncbi:hypothetical protein BH24CHL3_BH24CHL3_00100 [soil metagenome]